MIRFLLGALQVQAGNDPLTKARPPAGHGLTRRRPALGAGGAASFYSGRAFACSRVSVAPEGTLHVPNRLVGGRVAEVSATLHS